MNRIQQLKIHFRSINNNIYNHILCTLSDDKKKRVRNGTIWKHCFSQTDVINNNLKYSSDGGETGFTIADSSYEAVQLFVDYVQCSRPLTLD